MSEFLSGAASMTNLLLLVSIHFEMRERYDTIGWEV